MGLPRHMFLTVAVVIATAALTPAAAQAGHSDLGTSIAARWGDPSTLALASTIGRLTAQEDARSNDPRLCEGLEPCREQLSNTATGQTVTIVTSGRFDWTDAGVGAAACFGLMMVGIGLVMVARHGHRKQPATPATR